MTLLQTQSPTVVLVVLRAQYARKLRRCAGCHSRPELIVTPDPCYGTMSNATAGWIGYYAVRCHRCQVHFPGDTSASNSANPTPTTLDEHRAALQSAVDSWNSVAA
ncbi:hypothetical protein GCM10023172_23080 [Hymenobacter ginsengisoli]|uniref:Uncharacterized protein n=1 Tax=Hymenobacter ginsengisoli TaxID=1051626 RepID=A0ABP8QCZ4_9BACT|nr:MULTISPECIES: hypothetical protein [unclassified Hymenobacter]MBO2031928.1 hypothetical protein [Hymenobacter sp. BT559]